MSNLDSPAFPVPEMSAVPGFSRRERACIDLRIHESGDTELDALIDKARRQEMASSALQGLLSAAINGVSLRDYANDAETAASLLISELERTDG